LSENGEYLGLGAGAARGDFWRLNGYRVVALRGNGYRVAALRRGRYMAENDKYL